MAHLLVGSLAHSGRWRGYLSPVMDQPRLVEGLDRVCRSLGGVTKQWRFDRMATVCQPAIGRVTATFSGVAKHYGVMIKIYPPPAGHRMGGGEDQPHRAATLLAHPRRGHSVERTARMSQPVAGQGWTPVEASKN